MLSHSIRTCTKVMVGFVAMFVFVHAQGEIPNGDGLLTQEGPFAEVVYIDIGADESIECIAADPGYAYIDDTVTEQAIMTEDYSIPQIVVEPPGIRVFQFENGLPEKIDELFFDEEALGLDGHAYVATVPFPTPPIPSPEQLLTLTTDNGDTKVVLLENTYDPDLNIDCTVFSLDTDNTDGYYLDSTGQTVKKKAVKRKVAKANKRKVNKKKAKKKAAVKRKKAKRKAAG